MRRRGIGHGGWPGALSAGQLGWAQVLEGRAAFPEAVADADTALVPGKERERPSSFWPQGAEGGVPEQAGDQSCSREGAEAWASLRFPGQSFHSPAGKGRDGLGERHV